MPLPTPDSALEIWYQELRDCPIVEMDVRDLARACRQQIYPEAVVPICLEHLAADPLAGALCDGELVLALKQLPGNYWQAHPLEREQFLKLAERAFMEGDDLELLVTEEDLR